MATTETTVYNIVKIFEANSKYKNSLGESLDNTNAYVLDKSMNLVPQGSVGELCISGDCLARGYLNKGELTQKVFVERNGTERTYKTGDLVRYAGEGDLEYLGRNDTQVSIHGLRVESAEIEAVVSTFPGIKQCAVVAENDLENVNNTKYLVCYLVSDADIQYEQLRMYLEKILPLYMIPTRFIQVPDTLPVTINGKLDMKKLKQYNTKRTQSFSSPATEMEKRVCQLWSMVLGIEKVGVNDDFFLVGGDSILSMQVVNKMRLDLGIKVTIKDIFVQRTIKRILQNLNTDQFESILEEEKEELTGSEFPLLPIQQWFFNKKLKSQDHWNQNFTIKTPNLSIPKLEMSLRKLIQHHDAFRLQFVQVDGSYVQKYGPEIDQVKLSTFDIQKVKKEEIEKNLENLQKSFNIEQGRLFCVGYVYGYSDNTARIHFAIHHLVIDTVSWRILMNDLNSLYNGNELNKGTSYGRWAKIVNEHTDQSTDIEYREECTNNIKNWNGGIMVTEDTINQQFTLDEQRSEALLRKCNSAYYTKTDDLLLTALAYATKEVTKNNVNFVTLEGHGREDMGQSCDVSNTVGWFTTMYPAKLNVAESLEDSIIATRNNRSKIPLNGIGYGLTHGYKDDALPKITFNNLGQFDNNNGDKDSWQITQERDILSSSDDSTNDNKSAIDVTVIYTEGKMKVDITSKFCKEKTKIFTETLKKRINQIVDHTMKKISTENDDENKSDGSTVSRNCVANFDPYIEFKNSKSSKTLFILPPGEGGAESYINNIVQHLQDHYNLIVFNNLYLHKDKHIKKI